MAILLFQCVTCFGDGILVTTHYTEVKQYAQKEGKIVNARMTFDKESLKPLYQLIIGEAGESCALSIAKRLGMPDRMLQTAKRAAYGAGMAQEAKNRFGKKDALGMPDEGDVSVRG